jgi:broad specificity phosphatase PhoE
VFGQEDHETQSYTLEDAAEAVFLDESTHQDGWRQAVRTRPLYSKKLRAALFFVSGWHRACQWLSHLLPKWSLV